MLKTPSAKPSLVTTGTAIAFLRTSDEIVVAADSYIIDGDDLTRPRSECKILQVGKCFFTHAKLMGNRPPNAFTVRDLAIRACKDTESIKSAADRFDALVRDPFRNAVAGLLANYPAFFKRHFGDGSTMEIVFFGIENDTLTFSSRFYSVTLKPDGFDVAIEKFDTPPHFQGAATLLLGDNTHNRHFLKESPPGMRVEDKARKLIEIAIDKGGGWVGGEIAILRVTKDGATWIDKGACPDIKRQEGPPTKPRQGFPSPDKKAPLEKRAPIEMIMTALALSAALIYLFIRRR